VPERCVLRILSISSLRFLANFLAQVDSFALGGQGIEVVLVFDDLGHRPFEGVPVCRARGANVAVDAVGVDPRSPGLVFCDLVGDALDKQNVLIEGLVAAAGLEVLTGIEHVERRRDSVGLWPQLLGGEHVEGELEALVGIVVADEQHGGFPVDDLDVEEDLAGLLVDLLDADDQIDDADDLDAVAQIDGEALLCRQDALGVDLAEGVDQPADVAQASGEELLVVQAALVSPLAGEDVGGLVDVEEVDLASLLVCGEQLLDGAVLDAA